MPFAMGKISIEKIGSYAFILGALIAILAGIFSAAIANIAGILTAILVVLGIIVGLLNIKQKEVVPFLLAALTLGLGAQAKFAAFPFVGTYIDSIMANIVTFVAPAAIIVAFKALYDVASRA